MEVQTVQEKMKKYLFLFTMLLLGISGATAQNTEGYIMQVEDGGKVYINLHAPDVKVLDDLYVLSEGGYITDPNTGQKIKIEPEIVGKIKITAVTATYSVARALGNGPLEPKMIVSKKPGKRICLDGEVTVMIAPAEITYPDNYKVEDGDFSDVVAAMLMEQLMQSDKIQLLDRSVLDMQRQEISMGQSGEVDFYTAMEYGKITGARYAVKITMQKPDVNMVSNSVDAGAIVNATAGRVATAGGKDITPITQFTPTTIATSNVKVSVNISTRVIDLQTGKVLFICRGAGIANGKPQITLDLPEAFYNARIVLNQGAEFKQTVTGKALDRAFKTIGTKLNEFFNGKI
jgi:hypothetical protein